MANKLINKTTKELAAKKSKKLAEKALIKGSEKVGDLAGQWAGDKIVGIIQGKNKQSTPIEPKQKVTFTMEDRIVRIEVEPETQSIPTNSKPKKSQQLTDFEIAEIMNRLLAVGRLRRKRQHYATSIMIFSPHDI